MSDLMSMANEVMKNFDPAKDKVEDFEKIPDGDYRCLIEEVISKQNEKGTNWLSLKASVMDGDYQGRYLFVNYFFTEKTTERSLKSLIKLAYDLRYELPSNTFNDLNTAAEIFNQMAGNEVMIHQKTSKNDFVNYSIEVLPF